MNREAQMSRAIHNNPGMQHTNDIAYWYVSVITVHGFCSLINVDVDEDIKWVYKCPWKKRIQTFRIEAGFESSYCWSQLRQHVVTASMEKSSLHIHFRCGCKD